MSQIKDKRQFSLIFYESIERRSLTCKVVLFQIPGSCSKRQSKVGALLPSPSHTTARPLIYCFYPKAIKGMQDVSYKLKKGFIHKRNTVSLKCPQHYRKN